jgi:hypothetical protein
MSLALFPCPTSSYGVSSLRQRLQHAAREEDGVALQHCLYHASRTACIIQDWHYVTESARLVREGGCHMEDARGEQSNHA